jgi:DNA-binding NtrC family response regulator
LTHIFIPMKTGNILVADDNRNVLSALSLLLPSEFRNVKTISNPNLLMETLASSDYDVVLLDMNFTAGKHSGNEGIYWLREIRSKFPQVEVVMFTAYGDIELAVTALKDGASDFILKPWDNEKLLATLRTACRLSRSGRELKSLRKKEQQVKQEMNRSGEILFRSESMNKVMKLVAKVAPTDANILITGENGTGKELIAREIHRLSERANEFFVPADLSVLPESLFESELFGYVKGAFTGADQDRDGKFMMAQDGTLFLDEIANIPVQLQSKLLTVLQTRTLQPVGSTRQVPLRIRLICATNESIESLVDSGRFREDLLYRINTIRIHLPPLRERSEDIPLLAAHYLDHYSRKYGKHIVKLDAFLKGHLQKLQWPGNIRELQHAMEKAVILSEEGTIDPDSLPSVTGRSMAQAEGILTLEEMEKQMISNTLLRNRNNLSATASDLGISRPTLYSKIRKYGL